MVKEKILRQKFFTRPTLRVAHDLLGKFLVRKIGRREIAVMITEVEAYDGPRDKASHASRGMTERNAIMFGAGGYFYVYLCYGMYEMLNIVTGRKNYPAAILFRGAIIKSPLKRGVAAPRGRGVLKFAGNKDIILDGPGKLTKFLKIDRRFNKKPAAKKTDLWFEDRGIKISEKNIKRAPRVGVAYAGPIWSKKRYRFLLTNRPK
ncbi:MAG TPA: DNA-3-methyladenine glycosylase [Candidatus Nanoarchaeia archaeon]|nr:DNA-3-methyladenine glycosylase [Candidatus Nanoarchaeia archaeon]